MGSGKLDAKPDTRPSNNKNKTLLHTQASDRTPGVKTRAVFFVGVETLIVALHVNLDKTADRTKETSLAQAASLKRC